MLKAMIVNFIISNVKGLIVEIIKATLIEKAIIIVLWILPIPLTLESYLLLRTIIKKRKAMKGVA